MSILMDAQEGESFNTAFIVKDERELGAFIEASFSALKERATKIINQKGAYQIQVTIHRFNGFADEIDERTWVKANNIWSVRNGKVDNEEKEIIA